MEVFEALETLGFNKYESIDDTILKKRYRQLSKKNHPDLGGNPENFKKISEAKEVLVRYLKDVRLIESITAERKEHKAIISLQDLMDLYHGKVITLSDGYELRSSNLKSNKVYISIVYSVFIDGIQFIKEQTVPYRLDDKYKVFCQLPDSDFMTERDLRIMIHNRDIQSSMKSNKKIFNLNFDHLVEIQIQIERIPVEKGE